MSTFRRLLHPCGVTRRAVFPHRMHAGLVSWVLAALLCLLSASAGATAPPLEAPAMDEALTMAELAAQTPTRIEQVAASVRLKLMQLLAGIPLLLVAIGIIWLAAWLGGFISRRLHWIRLRTRNPYMDGLIRNVVRTVIVLAGILVALDLLNATSLVGAVLGSAGVVGLVVGFAFRDIAENYIAGILLSLRRPFEPGDHVRIDDREGRVVALSSRATMLMTLEGNELRVPNAVVFKAIILNYTRNPRRRFEFTITIDESQSIRQSQTLALERIAGVDGVLADPGPSWTIAEYTPSGIVLRFFGWVDQTRSDLGKARSESIRQVKAAFAQAGIISPRTTYHLVNVDHPPSEPPAPAEPAHAMVDTSVNTDIDQQLEEAQRSHGQVNLLEPEGRIP